MGRGATGEHSSQARIRRTTFGWSDLVTIRIPRQKAELLANASSPAASISFASPEDLESERAVADVLTDISRQCAQQLTALHGDLEFPDTWLIDVIRERFDDPATIALLELLADAARGIEPSAADDYWLRQEEEAGLSLDDEPDLIDVVVELYNEWLAARPQRLVPPSPAKSPQAEAVRLRRAGHEYWRQGEKGKAADCFDQALFHLLGPDPEAAEGAVVMDDPPVAK